MTRVVPHLRPPAASLLLAGLLLAGAPHPVQPEGPAEPPGPVRAGRPEARYVGVGGCATSNCHGAREALAGTSILQNEHTTWLRDPHRGAYETLLTPESAVIVGRLQPGARAAELPLCLDCHTLHVPAEERAGLFLEDGISCEACHGPAGAWRDRHYETGWSREDSLAAGLEDLADPARRAEVCLGCHLGDANRTVDHRLIAAGHPRLTFELDNYSEGANVPHWRPDPSHGARAWAVGQVVSFREGLAQLARRAAGSGPWPEFAELSCRSCHHSLEDPLWDEAGYRFGGGLPPWSPARFVVLQHLLGSVAPRAAAALEPRVVALAAAIRGMSDRRETARLARQIAADLEPLVARLDERTWNRRQVRGLMRRLAADREALAATDVDAAGQVFFALQSLSSHLCELDPEGWIGHPIHRQIDRLKKLLDRPAAFDRRAFAEILQQLEGIL